MPDFNQMQRRRLAAKRQAMPDGGFPIRNVSDLKNAIQAFGRANNKPAVKAWIKKRAKELGREDLLPDNWRTDTLMHHGIKGQKWGIRRFQREDDSLTSKGRSRYSDSSDGKPKSKKSSTKVVSKKKSNEDFSKKVESGKKAAKQMLKTMGPMVAKTAAIAALAAVGIPYSALLVNGVVTVATGVNNLENAGVVKSTYNNDHSNAKIEMGPIKGFDELDD